MLTQKKAWEKCRDYQKGMDEAISQRDFPRAMKLGAEAIGFARSLPEPMASFEIVRYYIAISQAEQQAGNINDALATSAKCVERAESIYAFDRQGKHSDGKQSAEVLMSACLCRAHQLLDSASSHVHTSGGIADTLKDAATKAAKAMDLCDSLFPEDSGNIARFKPRRVLGLIKERQEAFEEAEMFARAAYDDVLRAFAKGVRVGLPSSSPELLWLDLQQLLVDELTGMLMRRNEFKKAESLAVSDFEHLTKTRKISVTHAVYADGLARLAQVRMQLPTKRKQADEDMTKCFKIREKLFSSTKDGRQLILADSAVMLTKIRESRGILNEESESYLKRAAKIYASCEQGIQSGKLKTPFNFHANIDADLTRVQLALRNKNSRSNVDVESDDDARDIDVSPSSIEGHTMNQTKVKTKGKAFEKRRDARKFTFQPDDGYSRMQAASALFEEEQFSSAVIILKEALDIFLRLNGPDHPLTLNARQNLSLATNKELNLLWREVITTMS